MPIILLFCCIFAALNATAEAWLPEKDHFTFNASIDVVDELSLKNSRRISERYYEFQKAIDETIPEYYQELIMELGNSNRQQIIDAKNNRLQDMREDIENAKKHQSNLEPYYQKRSIARSIEYGLTSNQSFGLKANYLIKENFNKDTVNGNDIEAFHKFKLYQDKKYIISVQSLIGKRKRYLKDKEQYGELRLMVGKTSKNKEGKIFYCTEIGYRQFNSSKSSIHLDNTIRIETKAGIILTAQALSTFSPKEPSVLRNRLLKKFSIGKIIKFRDDEYKRVTLQVGYFSEYSFAAKHDLYSGGLVSLSVEF